MDRIHEYFLIYQKDGGNRDLTEVYEEEELSGDSSREKRQNILLEKRFIISELSQLCIGGVVEGYL